jgi:signal transduction histidine kinase
MSPKTISLKDPAPIKNEQIQNEIEIILSFLLLLILLFFSYTEIFLKPYLGFTVNLNSGVISGVDSAAEGYLEQGDQILSVNDIPIESINDSVWMNPFLQAKTGELWQIRFLRDGAIQSVAYPKPPQHQETFLQILSGDWILPYPFFAAGIITVLFLRPRTRTRQLLITFFYLYALWISAGLVSPTGYWYTPTILRVTIWCSVPVVLHLHWYFPKPFKQVKLWLVWVLYGFFASLAILDLTGFLPSTLYLGGFLFSLLSALTILVVKWFRFKPSRRILAALISGYLIVALPLFVMTLIILLNVAQPVSNIALVGLTAIPGFYFFSAYRIHLKQEIPRVNRAMRLYYGAISLEFILSFSVLLFPSLPTYITFINYISFLIIILISLSGFGILLIMPALANDQVNLFTSESYTLRLSANRAAAFVIFILLIAPITLLILLLVYQDPGLTFPNVFITTLVATLTTGLSILIYQRYQQFFNRMVLGIQHPPEALIREYAQRITTSLDQKSLANLLGSEILPSVLIRQSCLVRFDQEEGAQILFKIGVDNKDIAQSLLRDWASQPPARDSLQKLQASMPWLQLVIPLQTDSHILGVWCFGRKDPDTVYDPKFIEDLEILAHQTILALLNIHQAELLRKLYNSNIQRQEAEKTSVARDLHDVILPSIGYLVELRASGCRVEEFEDAIQRINNMIRNIMSGLRPGTLDLGLNIALEELADDPLLQIGGQIDIQTNLYTPEPVLYDKNTALHLYRIVQQACRNALEHAGAEKISITGTLLLDSLDLHISDDGVGFPAGETLDLGALIRNRHFGLANMQERARLINAELEIASQPEQGTQVHLYWSPEAET